LSGRLEREEKKERKKNVGKGLKRKGEENLEDGSLDIRKARVLQAVIRAKIEFRENRVLAVNKSSKLVRV